MISVPGAEYTNFSSDKSIFEYDVVFWDPVNTWGIYADSGYRRQYRGLPSLDDDESVAIMGDIARRRKEFDEFLKMGRTLVVFAAPPQGLYVDTGERHYSGTGKNRQTTRIVDLVDLLDALPFEFKATTGSGTGMAPRRADFGSVWKRHSDRWYYRAILEKFPGTPLMVVANTAKAVASIWTTDGGGIAIVLPDLLPLSESDGDLSPEETGAEEEPASPSEVDPALVAVVDWLVTLRGGDEPALPSWAEDIQFPEDKDRETRLAVLEREVQERVTQISEIKAARAKDERWKLLITGTGSALEDRVREAFGLMGFESASDTVTHRRDLHLRLNDRLAVVEVKGLNKSASEANAAQLEKWVAEALAETGKPHKGILVVNAWRDIPIRDRREPTFPHQMLRYCEAREHCLITGLQLLSMVRALLNGAADAKQLAEAILECVGPLNGWDDPDAIFIETVTTDDK